MRREFALLALTLREPPAVAGVAFDRYDGATWRRMDALRLVSWGSHRRYTHLNLQRLQTWAELRTHWPQTAFLQLALEFYYDSIVDAREKVYYKALSTAAIAFEILLAGDLRTELSHRMSQRGALLVASGADAQRIYAHQEFLRPALGTASQGGASGRAFGGLAAAVPHAGAAEHG